MRGLHLLSLSCAIANLDLPTYVGIMAGAVYATHDDRLRAKVLVGTKSETAALLRRVEPQRDPRGCVVGR